MTKKKTDSTLLLAAGGIGLAVAAAAYFLTRPQDSGSDVDYTPVTTPNFSVGNYLTGSLANLGQPLWSWNPLFRPTFAEQYLGAPPLTSLPSDTEFSVGNSNTSGWTQAGGGTPTFGVKPSTGIPGSLFP